jgi:hypothetical protein
VFVAGARNYRGWRSRVGIESVVSLWCAIHIDVHGIWSLIFLESLQTANIAKGNRVLLGDQDIGWPYGGMAESVLVQSGNGVGQAMQPIQYKPSPVRFW